MDKKDLENLSEQELSELKDSIDETIANKRYKKSFSATNTSNGLFNSAFNRVCCI